MQYLTKKNPDTSTNKNEIGTQIIFFALNFLAVPFSAYATYQGYKETAGGDIMAIILAALTGILFFGLNFLIMERRRNGKPHVAQTLGYIIPLGISFIGNFTNFYGNQVEGNVLKNELAQYSKTLKTTYEASLGALDESTGLADFELKLNTQLSQLKAQSNSGWGANSNKEWKTIQELCNGQLTPIYGNKTYQKAKDIADLYYSSLKQTKNAEIDIVKNQINNLYKPLEMQADSIGKDKKLLKKEGSTLINKIRVANDDIGEITRSKIPEFINKSDKVHIKVGKENPMQTLKHAWGVSNRISMETITATFFSLIIDLVTLAFIFLAYSYAPNKRKTKPRKKTL